MTPVGPKNLRCRTASLLVGLVMTLASASASAAPGWDLRGWLQSAGTQLVAVEFFATYCKPCIEAVPRWKKLHQKYRKMGLRLVVVSVQDPDAGCQAQPWNPDYQVCDYSGSIHERFDPSRKLPRAFLWSWQGDLLVSGASHIDAVESAIKKYLADAPRVLVSGKDKALTGLVEEQLGRVGKITVVLSEAERKKLRSLKRQSRRAGRADAAQCQLGQELSANMNLAVSLQMMGGQQRLFLQLQSIERGCGDSVSVPYDADHPVRSVAEGVDRLLGTLRRGDIEMPNSKLGKGLQETIQIRDEVAWDPTAGSGSSIALVTFQSEPPGALVTVDGEPLCQATPCTKAVTPGNRRVQMAFEEYQPKNQTVKLRDGQTVRWQLDADFAVLNVTTTPPGLQATLDGKPLERPANGKPIRVSAGPHILRYEDHCYRRDERQFNAERGTSIDLVLAPPKRMAAVKVIAQDSAGNAIRASVVVDGKPAGTAYAPITLPVCSQNLVVQHPGLGDWELSLDTNRLTEQRVHLVKATLVGAARRGGPANVEVLPGKSLAVAPAQDRASALVVTAFDSTPQGASVTLDGKMICKTTPCSRVVNRGRALVRMFLEDHVTREESVALDRDQSVSWPLLANFATVSVRSEPSNIPLFIDGEMVGYTPFEGQRVAAGKHQIWVGGSVEEPGQCWLRTGLAINVGRGANWEGVLRPKPIPAGISITARDKAGNDQRAEVWVDGAYVGRAPGTFKVGVCSKEVEVRHPDLAPATLNNLDLRPQTTRNFVATLQGSSLEIRTSKPGVRISVDGRFAGLSPLSRSVRPGQHEVAVDDPCYRFAKQTVKVREGKRAKVSFRVAREPGGTCVESGLVSLSGLSPEVVVTLGDTRLDGRTIANGAPVAVPVGEAQTLTVEEPGRVPWSRDLLLNSAVHRNMKPSWLPVRFEGATGGESVAVVNLQTMTDWRLDRLESDALQVPEGTHLEVRLWPRLRGVDTPKTLSVELRVLESGIQVVGGDFTPTSEPTSPPGGISLAMPSYLVVDSDVPDLVIHGPDRKPLAVGDGPMLLRGGGTYRVTAGSPRHKAREYVLDLEPGKLVQLDISDGDLELSSIWQTYADNQANRNTAWLMVGGAGALGIAAGVLGGLYSERKSVVDDLYADYTDTSSVEVAAGLRPRIRDAAETADLYLGLLVPAAIGAAALAGLGTYLLMSTPTIDEPEFNSESALQIVPWLSAEQAGLSAAWRW